MLAMAGREEEEGGGAFSPIMPKDPFMPQRIGPEFLQHVLSELRPYPTAIPGPSSRRGAINRKGRECRGRRGRTRCRRASGSSHPLVFSSQESGVPITKVGGRELQATNKEQVKSVNEY